MLLKNKALSRNSRFRSLNCVVLTLLCTFLTWSASAAVFLQNDSGLVSVDAEHYANKTARSGHDWILQNNPAAGFAGSGVMQSTPNNGAKWFTDYATRSPRLDYDVEFNRTGTHYIWVRGVSPDWGSDSLHVGLNGQEVSSAAGLSVPANSGYGWGGGVHTINITSTGVNTINVWVREDGVNVDKLILTNVANFTPNGTGPAESQQSGSAAVATPAISPAGGTFNNSQTVLLTSNTAGAVIYYTLDGGEPTTSSLLYSSPFELSSSATVKAKGFLGGLNDSNTVSASFVLNAANGGTSGAFQQNGAGIVSIEGEHFTNKTSQSGHAWVTHINPPAGFSGTGVMQSTPDNQAKWISNYVQLSPRMDYEVEFSRSGTHYIWVRGASPNWASDSLHVGMNGQAVASAAGISVPAFSGYGWGGGVQTINVPAPGVHTINVWIREDGVNVDKLILASAANFSPSGTGPAESQQSGSLTGATPAISPAGGTFSAPVAVTLVSATAGAVIYYTLDGSEPDTSATRYSGTFQLSSSAIVKAKGFLNGSTASATASSTFTFASNNQPPMLLSVGDQTVQENQPLVFSVSARDDVGNPALSANGLPAGASFTPSTGAFSWTPASGAAANSPYAVTFTATDSRDSGLLASETINITVNAAATGGVSGAFQQNSAGLISVEAENYTNKTSQSGHDWILQPNPAAGFSGSGLMQSTPDNRAKWTTNYSLLSPRMDYKVEFKRTGVHYIWVRGLSPSWASDSLHVGLDGQEVASAAAIGVPANSGYGWGGGAQTINVFSTGVHTINVWIREDGVTADKLVITTDADYIPAGIGPAQSSTGNTCTTFPSVSITSPRTGQLQTENDLAVETATCVAAGFGVKLVLDGGPGNAGSEVFRYTAPFNATFSNLAQAEHSVTALIVDSSGNVVPGSAAQDTVSAVAIGDYYVAIGDSITVGVGDNIASDNVSLDGRNSGGGYTPVLNNLLTAELGYPHTVVNAGVAGINSAGGFAALPNVLSANPGAQRYLVKYGMNDARPFMPVPSGLGLNPGQAGYPGSFKDNMQKIINAINNAGKEVVLAKINIALADGADSTVLYPNPEQGARSVLIREFNLVLDELQNIPANNIRLAAPDFYEYFLVNFPTEYSDNIHPNGDGYKSMADLWLQQIIQ